MFIQQEAYLTLGSLVAGESHVDSCLILTSEGPHCNMILIAAHVDLNCIKNTTEVAATPYRSPGVRTFLQPDAAL